MMRALQIYTPVEIKNLLADEAAIVDMATSVTALTDAMEQGVAIHLACYEAANELCELHDNEHPAEVLPYGCALALKCYHLSALWTTARCHNIRHPRNQ